MRQKVRQKDIAPIDELLSRMFSEHRYHIELLLTTLIRLNYTYLPSCYPAYQDLVSKADLKHHEFVTFSKLEFCDFCIICIFGRVAKCLTVLLLIKRTHTQTQNVTLQSIVAIINKLLR